MEQPGLGEWVATELEVADLMILMDYLSSDEGKKHFDSDYRSNILSAWKLDCLYGIVYKSKDNEREVLPCFFLLHPDKKNIQNTVVFAWEHDSYNALSFLFKSFGIHYYMDPVEDTIEYWESHGLTIIFSDDETVKGDDATEVINLEEEGEKEEDDDDEPIILNAEQLALNTVPVPLSPIPTTEEALARVLAKLEREGIKLTLYGNISCRSIRSTTGLDTSPVQLLEIDRMRGHIPFLFKHDNQWSFDTSYGMKSTLESWRKVYRDEERSYVSHGNFIAAMILEGYQYRFRSKYNDPNSPCTFNCVFNCATKNISSKSRTGATEESESESENESDSDNDSSY